MKHSLEEIAKAAGARLMGDGTREVGGISSIESATADDLIFVEDERRLEEADRKSTRLNSSHIQKSRMPSSA